MSSKWYFFYKTLKTNVLHIHLSSFTLHPHYFYFKKSKNAWLVPSQKLSLRAFSKISVRKRQLELKIESLNRKKYLHNGCY